MDAIAATLDSLVSVSAFNRGEAGAIFSTVKSSGRSKLVMRRNEPECVLVSPQAYSDLMKELEDLRDYKLAVERLAENSEGKARPFAEILAEDGLTLEDVEALEDVEFE